jgi:hypothetical protein
VTIASPVDSGPGPGGEPVPALRFAEVTRTGLRECLAALLPASADLVSEEVS